MTGFHDAMQSYSANLEALREYASVLTPLARESWIDSFIDLLEALKVELMARGPTAGTDAEEHAASIREFEEAIRDLHAKKAAGRNVRRSRTTTRVYPPQPANEKEVSKEVRSTGNPGTRAIKIVSRFMDWEKFRRFRALSRSESLLNRSGLVTLVSYFELFFAQLLRLYYSKYSDALSSQEKTLSVDDVKNFASIEELVEHVKEEKVDNIMRQSIDSWHEFIHKKLGISLSACAGSHWPWIYEVYQRRNILIHNDGVVNSYYLSKMKPYFPSLSIAPKLGEHLSVSSGYLEKAIDIYTIMGICFGDLIWGKLAKDEATERDDWLVSAIYEHLLAGNWFVAEAISAHALNRRCATVDAQLMCKMNYWLSIKRLGRWDEVKADVEKFDVRACHPKFSLAYYSLLEDFDRCLEVLPGALNLGLDSRHILEWPILEEFRSHPDFEERVARKYLADASVSGRN